MSDKFFSRFLVRKPAVSLVFSFLLVILVGTFFLKMPWATVKGNISTIDALFTATSATCVTGLIVKDTATEFTLWGKIIILLLIQIGGLGIMTAGAFLFLFFKKEIELSEQAGLKKILDEEHIGGIGKTIKFIILSTFTIEIIGAGLLFLRFRTDFSFLISSSIIF